MKYVRKYRGNEGEENEYIIIYMNSLLIIMNEILKYFRKYRRNEGEGSMIVLIVRKEELFDEILNICFHASDFIMN